MTTRSSQSGHGWPLDRSILSRLRNLSAREGHTYTKQLGAADGSVGAIGFSLTSGKGTRKRGRTDV